MGAPISALASSIGVVYSRSGTEARSGPSQVEPSLSSVQPTPTIRKVDFGAQT